jgi:hypothetical protein
MKHLTFSNVAAALALFIALGGSAWALATDSVKSKHIVDDTVKSADLNDDQVKSVDLQDDDVRGEDVEAGSLSGADIADGTVDGSDVNEAALTAGGELTGTLSSAALADEVVDADALAELPSARLELPRDSSNCAASVSVPASTVVDVPWLSADEGGGLAPLPECATDVIVPVGGFYLITVRIEWGNTGGANEFTTEIARAGSMIASDTTTASGLGATQTLAMATSVGPGVALTARVSHDGNANATLLGRGEMVVHYLGP